MNDHKENEREELLVFPGDSVEQKADKKEKGRKEEEGRTEQGGSIFLKSKVSGIGK